MTPFLCRIANGISLTVKWIIAIVGSLFNEGKLVRRSIVFFAMCEIHYVIHYQMPRLDGVYLQIVIIAVIGMLATVLAFYTNERNRDDKNASNN